MGTLVRLARVRFAGRAPLLLPAAASIFNLWSLRAETAPVFNLNDSAVHLAMVRWARQVIDGGGIPLDGWFPYFALGTGQFHRYQSLPHILTAYLSLLTGTGTAFTWTLYLLLALWPISVYLGCRLLGWDGWTAGAAALVSPLLMSTTSYGYEHGSYLWRGLGVWSQLWAMWLMPLAWGLTWRAVRGTGSLAAAALVLALTIGSHFLTAYLALVSVGVFVVAAHPRELVRRLLRGGLVGVGALAAASWVVVPLLSDVRYTISSAYVRNSFWTDSYGAPKVLGWLFQGQIFDDGRFPVVSLLVAAGVVVCAWTFRRDERARVALGVFTLSLLLFIGRPTLGPLLNLLPFSSDLLLHRYIMGVHMGGIVLAGIGGGAVARGLTAFCAGEGRARALLGAGWRRVSSRVWPAPRLPRAAAAAGVLALGLAALSPAWTQIADYDALGGRLLVEQQGLQARAPGTDMLSLIDTVKTLPAGRVYAGNHFADWGRQYRVGYVPVYEVLPAEEVDSIGFYLRVASLNSDSETVFDDTGAGMLDLFGVRYLILPPGHQPPAGAVRVAAAGAQVLWSLPGNGYIAVGDTVGPPIGADRSTLYGATAQYLRSDLPGRHLYQLVAFDGAPPGPATSDPGNTEAGSPGSVTLEADQPEQGVFTARVALRRTAAVILKASFEPEWRVTVDGVQVQPHMVAPALLAVTLPPGGHAVVFRYQPYSGYPALLALGAVALAALQLGPLVVTRLRRRPAEPRAA